MKPRPRKDAYPRLVGKADRDAQLWTLGVSGMRLYEKYAGLAMLGILAAQARDPDAAWLRRRAFRIGCEMAEEAVRLRRKRSR